MTDRKARPGYHHGDARNALIKAAGEQLETVGAAGLSLRQLAERAGLSRQAPYNHFEDKEALLAELVRDGFARLTASLKEARAKSSGEAALARGADTYIGFAQSSPSLFRLMFSRELVDLSRFPEAKAAADGAYAELVAVVGSIVPAARVADISLAAWCLVQGYAMLCNEIGLEPREHRSGRARLFANLLAAAGGNSR